MICNILDNTTELYIIKYTIGEIFSSGGATLYKNPSDQTVRPKSTVQSGWTKPLFRQSNTFIKKNIPVINYILLLAFKASCSCYTLHMKCFSFSKNSRTNFRWGMKNNYFDHIMYERTFKNDLMYYIKKI